jgi:hypothetical protein
MTRTATTVTATGKTAERKKKRKRTTMQPCWCREEREAER